MPIVTVARVINNYYRYCEIGVTDDCYSFFYPKISVSGKLIDLSKLADYGDIEKIDIGDTVHVCGNDGTMYTERVIKLTEYPLEPKETTVEIGHIEVNPFSFIWQMHQKTHRYDKSLTTSGGIASRSLSGVLNSTRNNVRSDNELLKIVGDLLTIEDNDGRTRVELGNIGREFAFIIYDKRGNRAIYLNDAGEAVFAGSIETDKDATIGRTLKIRTLNAQDEGGMGIQFLAPDLSIAAQIEVTADGAMFIEAAGKVYAGQIDGDNGEIATLGDIETLRGQITNLSRRVSALEESAEGGGTD